MNNNQLKSLIIVISTVLMIALGTSVWAKSGSSTADVGNIVSNSLDMQFNVRAPATGGSGGGILPDHERITVVVDTGDGSEVASATIDRTRDENGKVFDEITLLAEQARQAVERAKLAGQATARIVIPDDEDEVSQIDLHIPKDAVDELADGELDLEIYTNNARIVIPNSSLQGLTGDLYFRVVPIKDETERNEVEERAKVEEIVREIADDHNVYVVARPMTIETNLSSRAVEIILPLLNVVLPTDEQEREAFLADLVIFIEHSDGDRQLVKPEVVDYREGQLGLKFGISKFSTFTILNMEGWEAYLRSQEESGQHDAYMAGYPDGTFKPDRGISRAEMAAILYRVEAGALHDDDSRPLFADIAASHWATTAIRYVQANGLMTGFPDGTFRSEQAVKRAEMARIVSTWLGLQGDASATFRDTADHWAEKVIGQVQQASIMAGFPDGTFQPDKALTRAEAVTLMNNILRRGSQDWTTSTWRDVPLTHWALQHIEEASVPHNYTRNVDGSESIVK